MDDTASDNVDAHTATNALLLHKTHMDSEGKIVKDDQLIDTSFEPTHQDLCDLEQQYFLKAIREDLDLTQHLDDAINSLKIVLAADQSFKTGETINLS